MMQKNQDNWNEKYKFLDKKKSINLQKKMAEKMHKEQEPHYEKLVVRFQDAACEMKSYQCVQMHEIITHTETWQPAVVYDRCIRRNHHIKIASWTPFTQHNSKDNDPWSLWLKVNNQSSLAVHSRALPGLSNDSDIIHPCKIVNFEQQFSKQAYPNAENNQGDSKKTGIF